MNKWLLYILVFILITSGCGRSEETLTPNTVTFSFPDTDLVFYRPLINDFYLEHPGITVKLDAVPGDQMSEQKGDVQVVTWDIDDDEMTWSAGDYIDLNSLAGEDDTFNLNDFFPGSLTPFRNNENLAAIPYGIDVDVLYYNKDLFENQGVSPPIQNWNWDNFLDMAARLTEREHNVYGYSASVNYSDSLYFLYQGGGKLLTDETIPALDSPANIAAMSWYSRLFSTLNVAPTMDQAQRSFGVGLDVFAIGINAGKIGMWTGAYSTRGLSPSNGTPLAFNYGIAPLPRMQEIFSGGTFEAYAISIKAQNVDASWHLVEFLSRVPNPRLIPARQSVATSLEYTRMVGSEAASAGLNMVDHLIVVRHDQADAFIKAKKAFLEAVSRFTSLETTPVQALQEAQSNLQP